MQKESQSMDITHIPELLRLAEEVQATKEPRVLTRDGEELVVVQPAKAAAAKRGRIPRGKPTTPQDPIWKLVGIGKSEGLGDVSQNKYKYLGQAYYDKHL